MCCPLDCDPNLKPGDPLPCIECRPEYLEGLRKLREPKPVTLIQLLYLVGLPCVIMGIGIFFSIDIGINMWRSNDVGLSMLGAAVMIGTVIPVTTTVAAIFGVLIKKLK